MNYQTLKTGIQQVVKTNGNGEITGALLQQSLIAMINALGDGYQFKGLASLTTPGTITDNRVLYVATEPGPYPGFGGLELLEGETALFLYDVAWHKATLPFAALAALSEEISSRELSEEEINERIDTIIAASDVKDIVGTYAELEAYDKSKLGDNDIIKVLQDSTHDGAPSYYRFAASTQSFTYVGSESLTYTQTQIDEMLELRELLVNKVNTVVNDTDPTNHYPTVKALVDAILVETLRAQTEEQEIKNELETDYAKKNGQYEELVAGYAKRIISPDGTISQVPFISRTTAGDESVSSGSAELQELRGNTVIWNMIGKTYIKNSEYEFSQGSIKIDSIPSSFNAGDYALFRLVVGHKYAIKTISSKNFFRLGNYYSGGLTTDASQGIIYSYTTAWDFVLGYTNAAEIGTHDLKIQVCDLTQAYGAGNEPTTYAEFLSRKPKVEDEFAFDAGTPVHVDVTALETTGFNQYNGGWELGYYNSSTGEKIAYPTAVRSKDLMPILPSTDYYFKTSLAGNQIALLYWDANGNYIGNSSTNPNSMFTTMAGAYYMAWHFFGATSVAPESICINLSWSGYRNGEYEPYVKHALDLSWYKQIMHNGSPLFEGGKLRSAGPAHDVVTPTKATKNIGVKVFDGTEDWARGGTYGGHYGYYIGEPLIMRGNAANSNLYLGMAYNPDSMPDKSLFVGGISSTLFGFFFIDDSIADVAAWKAHLASLYAAGTPLVANYELADPVEAEYETKSMVYQMDDFGTETFLVNTPSAPVANKIFYMANLVDEIRNLPKNYQSQQSMDNLLSALGTALGLTITKTYNEQTKAYTYVIVQQS